MRRAAVVLLSSLPLPGRPVPLSAQSCAERGQRHATEFAEAPDERREGKDGRVAKSCGVCGGGSTAGTVRERSALAATLATSTQRSDGSVGPEASQRLTPAPRLSARM